MAGLRRKNVSSPDETRAFPLGSSSIVRIGETSIARIVLQPGWRWSEHVQPLIGGESCQAPHLGHLVSGRLGIRMDDGTELALEPGDVYEIPPGHDGWSSAMSRWSASKSAVPRSLPRHDNALAGTRARSSPGPMEQAVIARSYLSKRAAAREEHDVHGKGASLPRLAATGAAGDD